jgi:UDP-glucose 4-epimerase
MVVNVGTGRATSILELIGVFDKLRVKRCAKREGDVDISVADTFRLERHFPTFKFVDVKKWLSKLAKRSAMQTT